MAHIVAIANQKGGVGKTTTAVNLAASLAIAERRTLLLDADPQGNATSGVGILKHELQLSLYDSLVEGQAPREIVLPVPSLPHLSVLPATQDLVGAELQLVERHHRESALRAVLDPLQADYDYVVVDCPPSLGLLTLNVLASANTVLIPIQCEYYGLEGISQLLNTVRLVQQNFNPGLAISGVLLTMYDARLNLCRQVAEDAKEYFGAKMFVTPIPRNVRLAEAPSFGKPILLYDVQSVGAKSYLSVAQELIRRLEGVPSNERPRAAPSQPADGVAALEAAAARVAAEHATTGEHSGSHKRAGGDVASNHRPASGPGEEDEVDADVANHAAAAPDAISDGAVAESALPESAAGQGAVADGAVSDGGAPDGPLTRGTVTNAPLAAGSSHVGTSDHQLSDDSASHDRAPDDQATLARASKDRAGGERDSGEIAATETASNLGDTDHGSSEAAAPHGSPVAVHAAEAAASETDPVAPRASRIDDTNAAELDPQQSQSHEPEVTT